MASRLDQLLDSIHPSKTLDETARRADEAINTFRCDRGLITDWEEFRSLLIDFVIHVMRHVLRIPDGWEPNRSFPWGQIVRVLGKLYGASGGPQAAMEMARTGSEGGLYRVLRDLAQHYAEEFAQDETSSRVGAYWASLETVEARLAAAKQYVNRFGQYLPSELTEGGAYRIVANMPKMLHEHPRLLQRLGRVRRF